MSNEELLKPRYKVIADYPNSVYPVGCIIYESENLEGAAFFKTTVHKFPHLFKKLEWWEERDEKDMPEYVKDIYEGEVHFIESWEHLIFWTCKTEKDIEFMEDDIIPASKEDFLNQKSNV